MDLSSYKINNVSQILPVYEQNPERFMRFYNAVYLLLCGIPEGGTLSVADHCKESSLPLFIQCACLCIFEEQDQKEITDAMLEFSDDFTRIRRSVKFEKRIIKPHFYTHKNK